MPAPDKVTRAQLPSDLSATHAPCFPRQLVSQPNQPHCLPNPSPRYSVAFDPLDGSSIIGANWAVRLPSWSDLPTDVCTVASATVWGTVGARRCAGRTALICNAVQSHHHSTPPCLQVGGIFGVWPGRGFVGRCAREQVAAGYAVYGPKTVLVLARPVSAAAEAVAGAAAAGQAGGEQQGTATQRRLVVQEFVLQPSGAWQLSRCGALLGGWSTRAMGVDVACFLLGAVGCMLQLNSLPPFLCQQPHPRVSHPNRRPDVRIPAAKKVFAPANLRAQADNAAYRQLVLQWMDERVRALGLPVKAGYGRSGLQCCHYWLGANLRESQGQRVHLLPAHPAVHAALQRRPGTRPAPHCGKGEVGSPALWPGMLARPMRATPNCLAPRLQLASSSKQLTRANPPHPITRAGRWRVLQPHLLQRPRQAALPVRDLPAGPDCRGGRRRHPRWARLRWVGAQQTVQPVVTVVLFTTCLPTATTPPSPPLAQCWTRCCRDTTSEGSCASARQTRCTSASRRCRARSWLACMSILAVPRTHSGPSLPTLLPSRSAPFCPWPPCCELRWRVTTR